MVSNMLYKQTIVKREEVKENVERGVELWKNILTMYIYIYIRGKRRRSKNEKNEEHEYWKVDRRKEKDIYMAFLGWLVSAATGSLNPVLFCFLLSLFFFSFKSSSLDLLIPSLLFRLCITSGNRFSAQCLE